ncbi:hypothetical protein [Aquirufa lenticrescens]|uniref:hypothetical protein n=1 Tax=Aquirufa lenticrescens TaxID=2696560 RepID=UPI001CAA417C|nr:hypothetical protein [Aquirufa lenticrescens]UAJ14010.1 hypothetical protein G9X62_05345 [Aquirufa lenticrescens]
MKRITLLLLFVASSVSAQTWNLSFGANTTNFIFTNSAGVNPTFLKPGSGINMTLGYEKSMSRRFQYDLGLAYSQYNAVGDVQNIPFSYQTDFMGVSGGIGPKLEFRNDFTLMLKARGAVQKMINGNQFLQNHYEDLSEDEQFSGLRYFAGFSLELEKKVNSNLYVYTQYQHLDTIQFGTSTLNFVPSTVSFGIKIQSK